MAQGDTKTQQYLDVAAHGSRADLPTDTCCNTKTQDYILDVAERIITEEETRAREDAILQDEIDELRNNPDVVDIVATYAALQAYDTQHLTNNDIIRVLADETHDGASTYYRFTKNPDTWTYVGEVGDYYTKSAADAKFQEKLTAGSNISISAQNEISATDTVYTLPPATANTLGGVKVGDGLSVGEDGTISAEGGSGLPEIEAGTNLWELSYGVYRVPAVVTVKTSRDNSVTLPSGVVIISEAGSLSAQAQKLIMVYGTSLGNISNTSNFCTYYITATTTGRAITNGTFNPAINVVDDLTTNIAYQALSANQGKVLNDKIENRILNGGTTAPTTATVGAVGTLYSYVDTTGADPVPHLMVCTAVSGNTYTWTDLLGGAVSALANLNSGNGAS